MALNLFRNPFEKLSIENQNEIKKDLKELKEYFSSDAKNTLLTGLIDVKKELSKISDKLDSIIKNSNSVNTKFNKNELEEAGASSVVLGKGVKLIVEGIKLYSEIPAETVDKFVTGVSKITDAFKELGGSIKIIAEASKSLGKIAAGIVWFGLALIVAAPIYLLALPGAILATAVIYGMMTIFTKVMGDKNTMEGITQGAKALSYMALGLVLFGLALVAAGPIYLMAMRLSTLLVFPIIFGALMLMEFIGEFNSNINDGINALIYLGAGILLFGLALLGSSVILQYVWEHQRDGLWVTALVIGTAIGLMFAISKIKGDIQNGAIGLVIMGVAILVIAGALWAASKILENTDLMNENMGVLGLTILGMVGLLFLLSKAKGDVIAGSTALIIGAVSLIIFSVGLKMFNNLVQDGYDWDRFGLLMTTIGGFALELGLIGAGFGFVALGAGGVILMGTSLIVLSIGLKKLQNAGIKPDTTKNLRTTVLGLAKAFLGIEDGVSWIKAIGQAARTTAAITAAAVNATLMISLGVSLMTIAKGIKSFQELDVNYNEFGNQITNLISPLINKFGEIGKTHGGSGFFGLGGGNVYKGIQSVMGIGNALTNIATGIQSIANLKFPIYGKDGEIESYFTIADDTMNNVTVNIGNMVTSLSGVFETIGKNDKSKWYQRSNVEKGIKIVQGIGEPIGNLAIGLKEMAELRFPIEYDENGKPTKFLNFAESGNIFEDIGNNIGLMISSLSREYAKIGAGQTTNWFKKSDTEKGIKIVQGIGDPIASLATGLSGMAALRFPIEYDKDGKPIKFLDFAKEGGTNVFKQVSENIKFMITGLTDVFKEIGTGNKSTWFNKSDLEKGIKIVMGLDEPLKFVTELTKVYSNTNRGANIKELFESVLSGMMSFANIKPQEIKLPITYLTLFKNNTVSIAEKVKDIQKIEKSFANIAKSMGTFKDNVNKLDIELLSESRGLFEAMAVISKSGTPSDIIARFGNSLDETFKKLAELIEQFGVSVENNTAQTTAAINSQVQSNDRLSSSMQSQQQPQQVQDNSDLLRQLRDISNILRGTLKVKNQDIF